MIFTALYTQSMGGFPANPIAFNVTGTSQLLIISGSAVGLKSGIELGVEVFVDNNKVGELRMKQNFNEPSRHINLVPTFIPLKLAVRQGNPYTLLLKPRNLNVDIVFGGDDFWSVTLIDGN